MSYWKKIEHARKVNNLQYSIVTMPYPRCVCQRPRKRRRKAKWKVAGTPRAGTHLEVVRKSVCFTLSRKEKDKEKVLKG